MKPIDPLRLLYAARTAVALTTAVHETLWSLFPDELIALSENAERDLLDLLTRALDGDASPPSQPGL